MPHDKKTAKAKAKDETPEEVQEFPSSEMTEEAFEEAADKFLIGLQQRYAKKMTGARPEMGETGDWVDELLLPIIMAVIQWWRNRRTAQEGE